MPNVLIREGYLESRRVAALGGNPLAERFYFHLLLVAGTDGKFESDPILLKNRCFPALDNIRATDVTHWVQDCISAGLVRLSEDVGTGKQWIEILRHEPPSPPPQRIVPEQKPDPSDENSVFPFRDFWNLYGKKVEHTKCVRRYAALSEETRKKIREVLPGYIASTPDVQYRKNPATWINNHCWEDELPLLNGMSTSAAITPEMRSIKGF